MTEEKNRDTDWDAVLKILGIIKSKITEETDLLWTNYNSAEELIAEINIIDNLLQDRNIKGVQVLGYLFAPTGLYRKLQCRMTGFRNI
ncbi:hypothetical protein [Flavobacterium ginsengisoli]|uniref:hypothetical protein n=1 Tax=Flavobacterium ginsengisoli TaxID=871694 RepID=UPI00241539A6|nr:hypothetical protein [Flavobacterium ginsengisoli]